MFLRAIKSLNWSLRKLRLPIRLKDKVVEIGSGGNPHPASHILVEKFINNSHRLKNIKIDRQTILADGEALPFRDNAFDFSIAFHVLEHVPNPLSFVSELSRISKSGYIETPNVLYERFCPFDVHLLEVAKQGDKLFVSKKTAAEHDKLILKADFLSNDDWREIFKTRPELFHVCHTWKDSIDLTVLNPEQSTDWHEFPSPGISDGQIIATNYIEDKISIRQLIINSIRFFYKKLSSVDVHLEDILVCPSCKNDIIYGIDEVNCTSCGNVYSSNPVYDFTATIGRKIVS